MKSVDKISIKRDELPEPGDRRVKTQEVSVTPKSEAKVLYQVMWLLYKANIIHTGHLRHIFQIIEKEPIPDNLVEWLLKESVK